MIELRLSENDQKLHDRLVVSSDDITLARYCAGVLLKKRWHAEQWERRGTAYEQQTAFTSALVIAYGRPFTVSKGWPAIPSDLIPYDDREAALHGQIIKLRHQVYAHSDSTRYLIKRLRVGAVSGLVIRRPALRLTADEATLFLTMTGKLLSSIDVRVQAVLATATAELVPDSPQALTGASRAAITFHRRRK